MIQVPQAADTRSFREACRRAPRLVAQAIEPSGEGEYVEAMREWIDQTTQSNRPASLRLVR
jgi:hypothetical protein